MHISVDIPIVGGGILIFEKSGCNDSQVTITATTGTLDDDLRVEVEISELLKSITALGGSMFPFFNGLIEKKGEE